MKAKKAARDERVEEVSILIKLPVGLVERIDNYLAASDGRERSWGLRLPALRRWIEEGFTRELEPAGQRAARLAKAHEQARSAITEAQQVLAAALERLVQR